MNAWLEWFWSWFRKASCVPVAPDEDVHCGPDPDGDNDVDYGESCGYGDETCDNCRHAVYKNRRLRCWITGRYVQCDSTCQWYDHKYSTY